MKLLPTITALITTLLCATSPLVRADDAQITYTGDYLYDARMAFIPAGQLNLHMNRQGEAYEVAGHFKTSRALSPYYTWNGIFAAVGKWHQLGPVTTAYMSRTTGKDDELKIVLTYPSGARVLDGPGEEFQNIDSPGGIDLISALFFNPTCYQGGLVHDGEDSYQLNLRSEDKHRLRNGDKYYEGDVVSCDYTVVDHKNRKRRVIVSLADVDGYRMAVQIRAKIPLLPDAIFRLRMPTASLQLTQVQVTPD